MSLISASFRKSVADVTRRKGRTMLVVLGIFIGVFGLTGINVTEDTILSAIAFTMENQATQPDVVMNVDKLDPTLLPAMQSAANVKTAQYETDLFTLWHVSEAPGYASIKIISYPDLQHVPLTPFELVSGRYPGPEDDSSRPGGHPAHRSEIVMEYGDTAIQTFNVGDLVTVDTVQGAVQLRVAGIARTSGIDPAITDKAQGYMSAAGIEQLSVFSDATHPNQPTRLRFILVKLDDVRQSSATASVLQSILSEHGVTVLATGFPQLSAAPLQQISGVFTLLLILIGMALLISFLLIASTVATQIIEQTAIVGTMKAMGGTRRAIVRGYLSTVLIYAALATLPGLVLGALGGYELAALLAASVPLALGPFTLEPQYLLLGLLVGFGVPLLAALVPLWNGTRITVREALSAYGVSGTVKQQLDSLGQIGAAIVPVETEYQFQGVPSSAVGDTAQRLMIRTQDRSPEAVDQLTFRIGDLARAAVMNGTADKGGGIANVFLLQSEAERHQRSWQSIYLLLYGLALIVGAAAIVGLANERTASVLERQREIGMLRAMGAGSWRVTQVFWVEGLALGGIAWCIGAVLGLPLAYLFLQVFGRLVAPADLVIDPISFLVMLLAIAGIATLASVVPSQQAARTPIAGMLHYE